MNYRADIQILRGLAVLMVVLFHLGLSSFQSGFLGVDVFFVISGFLMAKLYQPGNVRLFFVRRAKRLLPAYFVVTALTVIVASILVVPSDYSQVKEQGFFALAFSSNIGFWLQNSYFSKTEFNPLLHLWSLGVEIQFYLFVPLLSYIYRKNKYALMFLFAVSFTACLVVLTVSPKTSFFIMPFRVWEFLLGYWAAFTPKIRIIKSKQVTIFHFLIIAGLLLIPFIPVDGRSLSVLQGHPALYALFVSALTALTLRAGLPHWLCRSVFGSSLEKLGQYSYSIYLVHFPVIVLSNYLPFNGTTLTAPNTLSLAIQIISIAALSYASHHIVERKKFKNVSQVIIVGTITILASTTCGYYIQLYKFPIEQRKIFAASEDRAMYRCGILFRITNPREHLCRIKYKTGNKGTQNVMLVGNSHADSIKISFANAAHSKGYGTYFYVANNPLQRGSTINPKRIIADAKKLAARAIVVHSSPNKLDLNQFEELTQRALIEKIKVSLILPVPTYEQHVPAILYKEALTGIPPKAQSLDEYMSANAKTFARLKNIHNFNSIRTADIFCSPECQLLDAKGAPFYFDKSHLTLTGAKQLENRFRTIF